MSGVNKVILIGNLGSDPEMRATRGGASVANLSVATTESWHDKGTGNKEERTEWHRVVFFGNVAEVCDEYLKKGSKVYVEGKLRTRKWQDKDGADRYTTEIIGRDMQMLDSKRDRAAAQTQAQKAAGPAGDFSGGNLDDDIPFAPYERELFA